MIKGFADVMLFGALIIVCLIVNGMGKPYNAQDRVDIQKSFRQKQGNVITTLTEAQKIEFDKTSPNSPSFW